MSGTVRAHDFPLNLSAPDTTLELPQALLEVSGIVVLESGILACIEDEHGTLYQVNPVSGEIISRTCFGEDGDYEGLARAEDSLFVLRSNGDLFEIQNAASPAPQITHHKTGIPAKDNEGLCYDMANNRLLIAAKSKSGEGPAWKNKRIIYAFDLETRTLDKQPAFTFSLKALQESIDAAGLVRSSNIKFRPSAIGIPPGREQLYLLPAADHLLFVFNPEGGLAYCEVLQPNLFPKAEGIAFNRAGDLFISNEGKETPATILKFNSRTTK